MIGIFEQLVCHEESRRLIVGHWRTESGKIYLCVMISYAWYFFHGIRGIHEIDGYLHPGHMMLDGPGTVHSPFFVVDFVATQ
jgi:hypothetical protein